MIKCALLLGCLLILLAGPGCSRPRENAFTPGKTITRDNAGPVTGVKSEDPEMNAAIAKARGSLDKFFQELNNPRSGAEYLIKVRFNTNSSDGEHIWLDQVRTYANEVSGRLTDEPVELPSLHKGQTIKARRDDVTDWAIIDESGSRGGYTAVLEKRSQKSPR
jgi:uncharacterized protein YegJ (DUF2314 family)